MLKILRLAAVAGWCLLVSIIAFLTSPIWFFFTKSKTKLIGNAFGIPVLKILGLRVTVSGQWGESHPCLYIVNHQSNWDFFILAALIPGQTVSIGKKSLGLIPIFGQLLYLTGNALINRHNHRQAMATLQQVNRHITRKNLSLLIFPEGKRSLGRGLQPFKSGAFHLAIQTARPLVPVVITPYFGRLDFNRRHSGTIELRILPPIETANLSSEQISELKEQCFELFCQAFAQGGAERG